MKLRRAPLAVVAAAAVCLLAEAAAAQPEEGSVATVAREIRTRTLASLGDIAGDASVVVTSSFPQDASRTDARADTQTDALVNAVLEPLLTALRQEPRFVSVERAVFEGEPEAAARLGAMRGVEAVIHLHLRTRGSILEARGIVFEASRGGLRDVFRPAPRLAERFVVRHRLDAHLRRYVGALPRVDESRIVARTVTLPGRGYLAMVATDLDGDGRTELVLARPEGAQVIRLGSSARGTPLAVMVGEAAAEGLEAAPSRPRRAMGTAVSVQGGAVVRTSHHAAPFLVRLEGGAVTARPTSGPCPDAAYPLADACAERVTGRDWLQAELLARPGVTALPDAPSGFYARAARRLPVPDGSWRAVDVVVTPRGRIGARVEGRRGGAVGYGAALGLADLEDDGLAEILTSSPSSPGQPDGLSLLRVREDGSLVSVWTSEEIEGVVMVAGHGDLDDDGREELLAIEEPAPGVRAPARLWVVQ